MALFDFITKGNQGQGNNNQQANQQQQPNQGISDKGTGTNGVLGDGKPNNDGNPANPLDAFKDIFNNKDKDNKAAPSFTLPEDKLNEVAGGLDFTRSIDPAIMQKAMSGDAGSMIEMMKKISQEAYKTALQHNSTLTGSFVESRSQYDGSSLSSRIKEELTNAEFSNNTPGFDHPLVRRELQKVSALISNQHPDASPAEVAKQAREYLTSIASAINPPQASNADANGNPTDVNWQDVILGKRAG